jgi:hypothetical protein
VTFASSAPPYSTVARSLSTSGVNASLSGIAAAVAVLGVLDEVLLGELEALGLPAAALVDGAHLRRELVLVAGDTADATGFGGGSRLLFTDQVIVSGSLGHGGVATPGLG